MSSNRQTTSPRARRRRLRQRRRPLQEGRGWLQRLLSGLLAAFASPAAARRLKEAALMNHPCKLPTRHQQPGAASTGGAAAT